MHLENAGGENELAHVRLANSSPGHNPDTAFGRKAKSGNLLLALDCVSFSARCQKAACAGGDDLFQGAIQIEGEVESAVKCDLKRPSQLDQSAGARHIHPAVRSEDAKSNPMDAKRLGCHDILLHHAELVLGIHKISAARADDDKDIE